MRTIDELGISPTPWERTDKHPRIVWNGENLPLVTGIRRADARLISAAPKLYKLILEAIPWLADISAEVVGNKCARQIDDLVSRMKAALAEASGEEVSK